MNKSVREEQRKLMVEIVGDVPRVSVRQDERSKLWWTVEGVYQETRNLVEIHEWMKIWRFTRFYQEGVMKLFPEDPEFASEGG